MTERVHSIIVELYEDFQIKEDPRETCILCCHSYVDEDRFYKCGLGNFHQCCGGTGCEDFELGCQIEALFWRIKELKGR